jgi:hypothetical protein
MLVVSSFPTTSFTMARRDRQGRRKRPRNEDTQQSTRATPYPISSLHLGRLIWRGRFPQTLTWIRNDTKLLWFLPSQHNIPSPPHLPTTPPPCNQTSPRLTNYSRPCTSTNSANRTKNRNCVYQLTRGPSFDHFARITPRCLQLSKVRVYHTHLGMITPFYTFISHNFRKSKKKKD